MVVHIDFHHGISKSPFINALNDFLHINKLYIHNVEKTIVFLLFLTQSVNIKINYEHIINNNLKIDKAFCLLPNQKYCFILFIRNNMYISIHLRKMKKYTYWFKHSLLSLYSSAVSM